MGLKLCTRKSRRSTWSRVLPRPCLGSAVTGTSSGAFLSTWPNGFWVMEFCSVIAVAQSPWFGSPGVAITKHRHYISEPFCYLNLQLGVIFFLVFSSSRTPVNPRTPHYPLVSCDAFRSAEGRLCVAAVPPFVGTTVPADVAVNRPR